MDKKDYKLCAIIPVFNHAKTVGSILKILISNGLRVIIVNDGGNEEETNILRETNDHYRNNSTLIELPFNQGKGGAVIAGLIKAYEMGFSHALQVDADGQHNLNCISDFITRSKENPESLVAGYPVYDEYIPMARKLGRKITTACVYIETISRDIKDAMCGFRIYPLESAYKLINSTNLTKRMDFDIEIIVRLHWMRVPMIFLPVNVIYPEDGISNFRMFSDNLYISRVHTLLFLGMFIRLPIIIFKKIFKKQEA